MGIIRVIAILASVLVLASCGFKFKASQYQAQSLSSQSANLILSAPAYQSTAYEVLTKVGCQNCHASGPAPGSAWFSAPDVNLAFQSAKSLIDKSNPAKSRLALRMSDGHCGIASVCKIDSSELNLQIKKWIELSISSPGACVFNGASLTDGAVVSGYSAAIVPFGNSCENAKVVARCEGGVTLPVGASATCAVAQGASCSFNGQSIASGMSTVAYQATTVPFGSSCQSETRNCVNGNLSGSFTYGNCTVTPPLNCTFNNMTVAHGTTTKGYPSAMVPYGQTCAAENITCTNGQLNPPNDVATCSVQPPANCTFNGLAVTSGASVVAFQAASVPAGQTCVQQTRSCTNGTLSGTYAFANCVVDAPAMCSFNGMTIASGGTVKGYPSASVPFGQTCQSQTITCNNGVLSPANSVAACTVQPPANCTFNGATVTSGASVNAYQAASVPFGSSCVSQTRTCTNGTLSGSYSFGSCAVAPGASCTFNGQSIASGMSTKGYASATVPFGQTCQPIDVTCTNGSLAPAAAVASCQVLPAPSACNDILPAQRVWPLSRLEYDNSVAAIVGNSSNLAQTNFPAENRANGFSNNAQGVSVDSTLINLLMNAAETIASQSIASELTFISGTLKCSLAATPSATNQDPCVVNYINNRGAAFYRRPLLAAEVSDLYATYMVGVNSPITGATATTSGIQTILTSLLQMPQFLYRTELGAATDTANPVQLTQYEIASAISFMATSRPPDATLIAAAAAGSLNTSDAIAAQYQRLITSAQGRTQVAQMVMQWLGEDQIGKLGSSTGSLTTSIANGMQTEAQNFIVEAVFNGTGTVTELLTGNYTFANAELAQYYGLSTTALNTNFSKVTLPVGSNRRGLLSQGAFLVSNSLTGVPLLHRGVAIRKKVLCETLPSVADLGLAGFVPPPFTTPPTGTTAKQSLNSAVKGVCYTCHQYFMPMGYALENFDKFGQYRTTDNGGTVDPSGLVVDPNSLDPASGLILSPTSYKENVVADYFGLTNNLASHARTNSCFANQVVSYVSGRNDVAQNECAIQNIQVPAAGAPVATIPQQFLNYVKSKNFIWRNR